MKVLNLFAGVGGNRKLWKGRDVTAVEWDERIAKVYQRLHPEDEVIVTDAHQYLLDHYKEFDFVWTSPPCQTHSRMIGGHKVKRYPDMALYQEIIFLQKHFKGLWVVENVKPYYTPLIPPSVQVGRHFFWSNFPIQADEVPQPEDFIVQSDLPGKQRLHDWLGIHFNEIIYYGNNHCPCQILRNCVHPKLGEQVFNCALMNDPMF